MMNSTTINILACEHKQTKQTGTICKHLVQNPDQEFIKYFNGNGADYELLCTRCGKSENQEAIPRRLVCRSCFEHIEEQGYWEETRGEYRVTDRDIGLKLTQREIFPDLQEGERLLRINPLLRGKQSLWITITSRGRLLLLDLDQNQLREIILLSGIQLMPKHLAMEVSDSGRFVAIFNNRDQYGMVVDIETGRISMYLDRGDYHVDVTDYSVKFFTKHGRDYLVHATSWNRLDISDPATGKLLTERSPTTYQHGEDRPEHYLDYFHASLSISPDQKWIVDSGWVWHPIGSLLRWDLEQWLYHNAWESEDGSTVEIIRSDDYYWDFPVCWIDNNTLAVLGYGNSDYNMTDAICIYDINTTEQLQWFPGPAGKIEYDGYLFSMSATDGLAVWDVDSGERLFYDKENLSIQYHRGSKQFLLNNERSVMISELAQTAE
jgi:hypothetical protein